MENTIVEKPWGKYEIIHNDKFCQVKKITIYPQQAPSLQYHNHRSEFWVITKGLGIVYIDDYEFIVVRGETVRVEPQQRHRIKNTSDTGDLEFIEVWIGEDLREDDIIRVDDMYGRADKTEE